MPNINLLGVVLAGIAGMGVGVLWYGPVFGKQWIKLMGFTKEAIEGAKKKGMMLSYALGLGGQLVTAYVLALLIAFTFQYFGGFSYSLVFWIWLGIVLPVQMATALWEGRSWQLFALNCAYSLAQLLVMALVLSHFI